MGNKLSKANSYYLMMDTEVFDRHGNFKGRFYKDLNIIIIKIHIWEKLIQKENFIMQVVLV